MIIQSGVSSTVETAAGMLSGGVLQRSLRTPLELREEDAWLHWVPAEQQEAAGTRVTKRSIIIGKERK